MDTKGQFFERLFKERYNSVYCFFLRKLGSAGDAADASQETFMRMVRFNGAISLKAPESYLFRIARNLATDMLRTRAVVSKYAHPADIDAQPSTAPLQDAALETGKLRELIKAAISELPPRSREVFILHQLKRLTYKEIGEQLGISSNTVKNHYTNALLKLRKALAESRFI